MFLGIVQAKAEKKMYREVCVRSIQMVGRVFVVPFCIYYYAGTFETVKWMITSMVFCTIFSLYIIVRESYGLKKCLESFISRVEDYIGANVDGNGDLVVTFDAQDLWIELYILNYFKFGVVDRSLLPYINSMRQKKQTFNIVELNPVHTSK